jgi:cytochrome c biogenesis factor
MLTIGCFLGGVWANESWGRYWSWDSKETWALVGILVYSVVLHLRLIPKLNTQFIKSSMSLLAILVILMTYLGVNYYLSGMHSYGKGTPTGIPVYVYLILVAVGAIILLAYKAENEHKNQDKKHKSLSSIG